MRKKNSYSRLIQSLHQWQDHQKGIRIQLFHHCVENKITSFLLDLSAVTTKTKQLGTALSESGLSRDKIQLIGSLGTKAFSKEDLLSGVKDLLLMLRVDYLDLLLLNFEAASEEALEALHMLRARGEILEIGSIQGKSSVKSSFLESFPLSANLWQLEVSTSGITAEEPGDLTSENISQFLAVKEMSLESKVFEPLENKYEVDRELLVLAWLMEHPAHFHILVDGKNEDEIDRPLLADGLTFIREDATKVSETVKVIKTDDKNSLNNRSKQWNRQSDSA